MAESDKEPPPFEKAPVQSEPPKQQDDPKPIRITPPANETPGLSG
jgi:hypothetical protein